MPINGHILTWDALSFVLRTQASVSHSGAGSGAYGHSAKGVTVFADTYKTLAAGIDLRVTVSSTGSVLFYDGPFAPFGGYSHTIAGWSLDSTVEARFRAIERWEQQALYTDIWDNLQDQAHRIAFGYVEIWHDGTLITTLGGGFDDNSAGLGPSYVPVFGEPFYVTASRSASTTGLPAWAWDSEYDYQSRCEQTVSGGWRWRETEESDWQSVPVALPSMSVPGGSGCPYGLSIDAVVASNTYGELLTGVAYSRSKRSLYAHDTAQLRASLYCYGSDVPIDPGEEPASSLVWTGVGPATTCVSGDPTRHVFLNETWAESDNGAVMLQPSTERALKRFGPDHRAIYYRNGFPATKASRSRSCASGGVSATSSDAPIVHAQQTDMLSTVGNSTHIIEQPLSMVGYAPCSSSRSKSHSSSYQTYNHCSVLECPPSWASGHTCPPGSYAYAWQCELVWADLPAIYPESESVGYSFPSWVEDKDTNPYIATYQYHEEPVTRYLNFWGNPLWQYFDWWPPNTIDSDDDGNKDQQSQWQVNGSDIDRAYWMTEREQWLYQGALPTIEQRRTRNHAVSRPILSGGHEQALDLLCGGQRWAGIHRWIAREVPIPSTLALTSASEPAWSVIDGSCTTAFGSDLVLSREGSATVFKLRLDCNRWDCEPFLYPSVTDRVFLDWSLTNVASVSVYAVGIDGSRKLLEKVEGDGFTTKAEEYRWPNNPQTKYAGSWGVDNGCYGVSDLGTDADASGVSMATMGDSERALAFQFLGGRQPAYLDFEVTPTDPDTDVTLHYPEFRRAPGHPTIVCENGAIQALLWSNGPGIRIGGAQFVDPIAGLKVPPNPMPLTYKSTIVDFLCWARLLCGLAHDDGLTTEIGTLFDTYEGQSVNTTDHDSLAFVLPKGDDETLRFALVNCFRETPPMSCWPEKSRDIDDWSASGGYAQHSWDWVQEKRHLITASNDPASLVNVLSGATWTAPTVGMPSGWSAAEHAHVVANDSTDACHVVRGGHTWASLLAWHGFFTVLFPYSFGVSDLWHWQDQSGVYLAAIDASGDVTTKWSPWYAPFGGWTVSTSATSSGGCSEPCLSVDRLTCRVYLTYTRGGNVYERHSDSRCASWSSETLVASSSMKCSHWPAANGSIVRVVFVPDSGSSGPGTIKAQRKYPGSTAWGTLTTVQDHLGADVRVADGGMGNVAAPSDPSMLFTIVIVPEGDTAEKMYGCANLESLVFRPLD